VSSREERITGQRRYYILEKVGRRVKGGHP